MRKILTSCVMALTLLLGGAALASAAEELNPVDIVTGDLWMMSKQEEKLSYILGVESAITVEYLINEKAKESIKKGKKGKAVPLHTLSPFEKGWTQAFKNVKREEIVARVDSWLRAHPDQKKKPVLAIIWNELIVPNISK